MYTKIVALNKVKPILSIGPLAPELLCYTVIMNMNATAWCRSSIATTTWCLCFYLKHIDSLEAARYSLEPVFLLGIIINDYQILLQVICIIDASNNKYKLNFIRLILTSVEQTKQGVPGHYIKHVPGFLFSYIGFHSGNWTTN